jgi:adenylate cyclase
VDETIEGREMLLKGYAIGVDVFKKSEDFDAEQNPLVRIHAGRLRRMLRLYYLGEGKNDPVRIEIPKGKYIPFFSNNPLSAGPGIHPPTDGDGIAENSPNDLPAASLEPSIAVLPFKNLTGDPDNEYLALGFGEELSVELTKFEDLVVIDSILLAVGEKNPHLESGIEKLKGVRFLIDGSIQLNQDQLKILVKLIDTFNGVQIWADRFSDTFTSQNISVILEQIARQVSQILGSEYGLILNNLSIEANKSFPQDTGTFKAILKFYHFEAIQSQESADDALNSLEQAIIKEPLSGIATAMLASIYGNRYMLDMENASLVSDKFSQLADRAIELDPNSITVRIIYASKCFAYNQKEQFFKEAEKCLSRCPAAAFRIVSLGMYISLYGDWERGMALLNRVIQMKLSFPKYIYGVTCLYHYRTRDYHRALEEAMKYDMPFLFWGPMLRAAVFGQLNKLEEAGSNLAHLKQLKPDFEHQAWYLITRYVKEEELAEHVLEGLRMAGMDMKPSQLLDYNPKNTLKAT